MTSVSTPIYCKTRNFIGRKDLVISFYAKKCPFNCSFCTLPMSSDEKDVPLEALQNQINWAFTKYSYLSEKIEQLSVGVEGSILDCSRFPEAAMNYLVGRSQIFKNLKILSLESRPEYIEESYLLRIQKHTQGLKVEVTVGFETQNDYLRNNILNKKIQRALFEDKVRLLGKLGIRLTSYVLLKPGPEMTEEEGITEAVATIEYLHQLSQQSDVDLTIYLNPTYVAKGSPLELKMRSSGYTPPKLESAIEVIERVSCLKLPIYVGLSSEGMAEPHQDFTGAVGYSHALRESLSMFNRTQDLLVLSEVTDHA